MNEEEFIRRFSEDEPKLKAWGEFVSSTICDELNRQLAREDLRAFLQIPPEPRVKALSSALDKAFTRKAYQDPYLDMEDKVGVRFVTVLTDDIQRIASIVQSISLWTASDDRDFLREKDESPDIFCYQSRHFVVRSREDLNVGGVTVPAGMPCEIQIRSMLQHVYSEVTHKTIYKSKQAKPTADMRRLVARSMALLETTDHMLTDVKKSVEAEVAGHILLAKELGGLYEEIVGHPPVRDQKSEADLLEIFYTDLEGKVDDIREYFRKNPVIVRSVQENRSDGAFFHLPIVIGVYFLADRRRHYVRQKWPFESRLAVLEKIYNDLGHSLHTE